MHVFDFSGEDISFGYTFPNRLTKKTRALQTADLQPFEHVGFYYGSQISHHHHYIIQLQL